MKNLEDGIVVLPPKLNVQASLASLFSKQRASGSGTSRAKSTSTGSKAQLPTPVSKLCEGIIPRKLGLGKKLSLMNKYCQMEAHPITTCRNMVIILEYKISMQRLARARV